MTTTTAAPLRAFHGDPKIKAQYLARVRAHAKADELIHGVYWERGKGCAIGCTIHSSQHVKYETELGIPQMIANLEDRIFEGMANGDSKEFPAQFLSAIRPGTDLSRVGPTFLTEVLARRLAALPTEPWGVRAAAESCLEVVSIWACGGINAESAARSATSAAWSAASAAESAARSAESAARSAAESAAWSAESAAWSAASAEYVWMRDTLLKLLRAAPLAKREGDA